jgi:hypothetical protein
MAENIQNHGALRSRSAPDEVFLHRQAHPVCQTQITRIAPQWFEHWKYVHQSRCQTNAAVCKKVPSREWSGQRSW